MQWPALWLLACWQAAAAPLPTAPQLLPRPLLLKLLPPLPRLLPRLTPVNTTDPITLNTSWWGGDARQAAYEAACKASTEKYPNITVECTYGPWNGWEEAQSTALAAGTAADVMQVNWNWLFQYSGKGQSFVNLNDYSDVLDLTQFPSSALDACTVANSLQAVPVAMAGRIYYWNMATFKKAGLDHYPTTEQELLDTAKTFQEKLGDDYYPLAAGPLDRMIMMTFYLESKYGEPWVTDSTLNYTVEQLQEGLEWIQSLEDNHVMPDLKTMNAAGDKTITDGQAWITGKYAGIFTWDSSALSASQNLPDDAEYVVGDETSGARRQRRFCQGFHGYGYYPELRTSC